MKIPFKLVWTGWTEAKPIVEEPTKSPKLFSGDLDDSQLLHELFAPVDRWNCNICGEDFGADTGDLREHANTHTAEEIYEYVQCPECDGEKFVDYADPYDPENSRKGACDLCNPHGDEPNEDEAYDRFKDEQAEIEMESRNGY